MKAFCVFLVTFVHCSFIDGSYEHNDVFDKFIFKFGRNYTRNEKEYWNRYRIFMVRLLLNLKVKVKTPASMLKAPPQLTQTQGPVHKQGTSVGYYDP